MSGRRGRRLRWALAALLLAALGVAIAQGGSAASEEEWSVQVVALRDLRQAEQLVAELRRLGFDAYSEFAMFDGRQFVRVRVGCSRSRDGAEALATVLAGSVTADAVAVPRDASSEPRPCLERSVGFLKPDLWSALAPGTYLVTVAGRDAVVVHDGRRWRLRQGDAEPLTTVATGPAAGYRDAQRGGRPVVLAPAAAGGAVLCPGRLLHDLGSVAIVEDGAAVVACRLNAAPPVALGGGAP